MDMQEARSLGNCVAKCVRDEDIDDAYALLAPALAERTPFRLLDKIGEAIGAGDMPATDSLLERIADKRTIGGWVIIAGTLGQQMDRNRAGAFVRCREYVILADIWHATDCFGERVLGRSLVSKFQPTLVLLASWREDPNRWIRRAVGVSAHFWAKRSRGELKQVEKVRRLLDFLDPMFEEWNMDAAKGVGWGLKTLGRYYPELLTEWLAEQILPRRRRHRAIILRKASTYLSPEQRARFAGVTA